jgi:hypothetical protein
MKSQLFDISNQNIKKSIQTKELQLSFWQKASHYQFVLVLFYLSAIFPLIVLLFFINDYYSGVQNKLLIEFIWLSPFFLIAALVYFFIQKKRLKMAVIETNLTREQIENIIDELCKRFNWNKWRNRKNLIVIKTPETFWSFFAAEQITILFDKNEVLVNSIRDLDAQRKAFGEIGKNAENVEILMSSFD